MMVIFNLHPTTLQPLKILRDYLSSLMGPGKGGAVNLSNLLVGVGGGRGQFFHALVLLPQILQLINKEITAFVNYSKCPEGHEYPWPAPFLNVYK